MAELSVIGVFVIDDCLPQQRAKGCRLGTVVEGRQDVLHRTANHPCVLMLPNGFDLARSIATEIQTKSASFSDIPFLMSPALNARIYSFSSRLR